MSVRLATILGMLVAGAASFQAVALDLQAHRGGRGLMPENTLAAFANALAMGVTTLEMDVGITSDGIAVVCHDRALNPALTRDGSGQWLKETGPLVKTLSLAEVQSYDVGRLNPDHTYGKGFPRQQAQDGQRIPRLAAVFALARELGANDVQFDIETKLAPHRPGDTVAPEEFVRIMLAVIREADVVDRVMIQSFDWRTLQLFQAAEPRIRTVYLTQQSQNSNTVADPAWTAGRLQRDYPSIGHMVKAAGGTVWAPNFRDIDQAAVKTAQSLGIRVMPWTVNEAADMRRLLGWNVDGIITDYPDRLRTVMAERGMPLPAGVRK